MIIKEKLNSIALPDIYMRDGKECYYDTYRKKLIEITPEETVRQRVASYFEKECGVPKEMIELEVPMSYYRKGSTLTKCFLLLFEIFLKKSVLITAKKGDAKKLNRVFSHPLLQRWSAHLWQNGMVEARSGIMNEG